MVLVVLLVLYFASPGPTPPVDPKPKPLEQNQPITPASAPASNVATKMLEIQLSEGTAQVWRNGNMIGTASAKVPFRFPAKVGEKVELLLRQEGYDDFSPARFFVESYWPDMKTVGTFTMSKKK
jgi:hypothetical protein